MALTNVVSYIWIPLRGSGRSGLTIEVQRETIRKFAEDEKFDVVCEFVELEADCRGMARPEMTLALAHAGDIGGAVLVAQLSCLSFDALNIADLEALTGPIIVAELGVGIELAELKLFAFRAEQQRAANSSRTKAFQARKKGRGEALGNQASLVIGRQNLSAAAGAFAAKTLPMIDQIIGSGRTTLSQIADELNSRGVRTVRGGPWSPGTVRNVIARRNSGTALSADCPPPTAT